MSLGKLSFKRKYTSEVDFVDEELEAALLVIKQLKEKRQKVIQTEKPIDKAFRLTRVEPTDARERIFDCLSLQESGQIFPIEITAIIAAFDGLANVHDLLVADICEKGLSKVSIEGVWKKGIYYPKGAPVEKTLPREISFYIASFLGCSSYDGLVKKGSDLYFHTGLLCDELITPCQRIPQVICHRSHKALCNDHAKLSKEYRIKGNLHVKKACGGCWILCPCMNNHQTDIPMTAGVIEGGPYKCTQCLNTICVQCEKSNRCLLSCKYGRLGGNYDRGLCIRCKSIGVDRCHKCLIARDDEKEEDEDED